MAFTKSDDYARQTCPVSPPPIGQSLQIVILGPKSSSTASWRGLFGGEVYDSGQFILTYSMIPDAVAWIQANWTQFLSLFVFPSDGSGVTDVVPPGHRLGPAATGVWTGTEIVNSFTANGGHGIPHGGTSGQLWSGWSTDEVDDPRFNVRLDNPPYPLTSMDIPNGQAYMSVKCTFIGNNFTQYKVDRYKFLTTVKSGSCPSGSPLFWQDLAVSMTPIVSSIYNPYFVGDDHSEPFDKHIIPVTSGNLINGWLVNPMPDYTDVSSKFVFGAGNGNLDCSSNPTPAGQFSGIDGQAFGYIQFETII